MLLPTTPFITADGAIASLIGLAETERIKQSDNQPDHMTGQLNIDVGSSIISVEAAASMGFGSMVDVNASTNATFYLYDFIATEPAVPGAPDSIVLQEYYGVGVRICVKAWGFDTSATVSLAVVTAKASAYAASVAYQVNVIGIRSSDLKSLPGLIGGSIGPFDVPKLQTVGAVQSDLTTFIANHPEECRPELVKVELDPDQLSLPFELTPSNIFACGRISAGLSYRDAIAQIPADSDPPITVEQVAAVYRAIVETTDNVPNATQIQLARSMLLAGNRK